MVWVQRTMETDQTGKLVGVLCPWNGNLTFPVFTFKKAMKFRDGITEIYARSEGLTSSHLI